MSCFENYATNAGFLLAMAKSRPQTNDLEHPVIVLHELLYRETFPGR
jgi:hypothetical protein